MMQTSEIAGLYDRYIMSTYGRPSLALVRGDGCRVWDAGGRGYLDFLAGIAVTAIGHAHPEFVAAVADQAARLTHVSNLYYNEYQPQLARELVRHSGFEGKAFFCNSGAEANETLIKLARAWGRPRGRYEILSMDNSFHGRTLATLTATGQEKVKSGFEPYPEGFNCTIRFNDLESVRKAVTGKTAAVLVEAVQGEGGVVPAEREFISGLRSICDEAGVLLFFDEVQCGMGRTGNWFGFQHYGIQPDAFSLAKSLAGGIPMGAVVAAGEYGNVFQPGQHASTFGGTPLACRAALTVLRVIEESGLLENAVRMGRRFRDGLDELAGSCPALRGSRGLGLMVALLLDRPSAGFVADLQREGLLAVAVAGTGVRFLPPLTVSAAEIDEALAIIARVCKRIS